MENEIAEIKTNILERDKGMFIIPGIAGTCAVIIFFVNSYLLIAGLSVIILFCGFLYINQLQLSKIARNIHFPAPENGNEIDIVLRLIQKEKTINTNIVPYIILYSGIVLCWAGIENTLFKLTEFALLQFVVFALIYVDQLYKNGRKYASLLETLELLSLK